MKYERKPLTSCLDYRDNKDLMEQYDAISAADEFQPVPRGTYTAIATGGECYTNSKGTLGYRMTFRIQGSEHDGRSVKKIFYLTPAAAPFSKRELIKFGLDTHAKLNSAFPANEYGCQLDLTVRANDDGRQFNEIREIRDVRALPPAVDPFAPAE